MASFAQMVPTSRGLAFCLLFSLHTFAQQTAKVGVGIRAAGTTFNVRSYGAKGDGHALDTAAIREAIPAANTVGGGIVVFPPGTYLSGTFELLSNVTLDLQPGSTILGSPNVADYGALQDYGLGHNYGEDSSGEGDRVGPIVVTLVRTQSGQTTG